MEEVVGETKNKNVKDPTKLKDQSRDNGSEKSRRFKNAGDAVDELYKGFNDWSGITTSQGMHTAYAIIAANWAVYGDAKALLNNQWAKASVSLVIIFLGVNLFCTWLMTYCYGQRVDYADKNKGRWRVEFEREKCSSSAWPYTPFIQKLGDFMRGLKVFVPILAGGIFVAGLFMP